MCSVGSAPESLFRRSGHRNEPPLHETVDVGERRYRKENFAIAALGQMDSMPRTAATGRPCVCSTALGSPVVPSAEQQYSGVFRASRSATRKVSGPRRPAARLQYPGQADHARMLRSRASPAIMSFVAGAQSTARAFASPQQWRELDRWVEGVEQGGGRKRLQRGEIRDMEFNGIRQDERHHLTRCDHAGEMLAKAATARPSSQ